MNGLAVGLELALRRVILNSSADASKHQMNLPRCCVRGAYEHRRTTIRRPGPREASLEPSLEKMRAGLVARA